MIEMLFAVTVGAILATIAFNTFGPTRSRMAASSARQTFAGLHARSRAHAIERGVMARLEVDFAGDSVWITAGGARVDGLNFESAMDVDLQSSVSSLTLCMSPRGFADMDCNSFGSTVAIDFVRGGVSRGLELLPIGHLEY